MSRNRILGWPIIIGVALLAIISGYIVRQIQQGGYATSGPVRPLFQLPDIHGTIHNIREWDGQVLVINFWATWCAPCRREIPEFIELQKKFGERGLQFIGVAIDKRDKVKAFIEEYNINYPVLISEEKGSSIAADYGNDLRVVPYTAFVNRAGQIVYTHAGAMDRKTVKSHFMPLL